VEETWLNGQHLNLLQNFS